jgi:hypothetical protein
MDKIDLRSIANYIIIICFFVVPLVVWMKHFHPFVSMKDFVFFASVVVSFSILIISFILEGKIKFSRKRISLLVYAFLLYNLISLVLFKYTDLHYFLILVSYIMLFYIVSQSFNYRFRNIVLNGLIIVAILSSIYAFFQFIGKDIPQFLNYFGTRIEGGTRAFSFFGNPNLLGGFCIFILPIIAVFIIKTLKEKKYNYLILYIPAFILSLATLSMLLLSETCIM